jgi:hypothetical protein
MKWTTKSEYHKKIIIAETKIRKVEIDNLYQKQNRK